MLLLLLLCCHAVSLQVHDYAAIACTLLHNHAPKRSLGGASSLSPAKRQNRAAVTSSYLVSNQYDLVIISSFILSSLCEIVM